MPTTESTSQEREAQLERYIQRDALGTFLVNLALPGGFMPDDERPPFAEEELVGYYKDSLGELGADLSHHLFEALWPDESGQSTAEFALANGRANLQVALIFSRLADSVPFLRERAAYFQTKAAEELLSAQEYVLEADGHSVGEAKDGDDA